MNNRAFSLIEVTVAIGFVAILVTSLLAILPQGMKAAQDAEIRTMTGMILEDVRDRLEGLPLDPERFKNLKPSPTPLFYDENGRFVEADAPDERQLERFYRVDLRIVKPMGNDPPAEDDQLPLHAEGLKAAIVELGWPVDSRSENGELLGEQPEAITGKTRPGSFIHTFLVTTLTGPDWEDIDENYIPEIEF